MIPPLQKGRYSARLATTPADLSLALGLRSLAFRNGAPDADDFDPRCQHVLIENADQVLGTFRLMLLTGADLSLSYSSRHYDLTRLTRFPDPILELGRFCLHPQVQDPDVLRLSWAWLTRLVDALHVGLLCGCSSFAGTDPTPYLAAFATLRARHLAPPELAPGPRSPNILRLADLPAAIAAADQMPPLLRTYLMMGGWVSDHAVIDRDLNTLHVFTAVEIARIPANRARALRLLAQ